MVSLSNHSGVFASPFDKLKVSGELKSFLLLNDLILNNLKQIACMP